MAGPDVLLEAPGLKALPRARWVCKGVPNPESVAGHAWGVAWLVMTLPPPELDRGRALAYAVLHDLPELRVGDLPLADGVSRQDKARREHAAMAAIAQEWGSEALLQLWEADEAQGDPEARFVRNLDRLDRALQALAYHEAGTSGLEEFSDFAARVVQQPALRAWLSAVRERMTA
jgi:putative hydrolase of HD superfamily